MKRSEQVQKLTKVLLDAYGKFVVDTYKDEEFRFDFEIISYAFSMFINRLVELNHNGVPEDTENTQSM